MQARANCESWVMMVSPHALVSSSRLGSVPGPGPARATCSTASRPVVAVTAPAGAGTPSREGPPPRRKAPSATFAWAGPVVVGLGPSGGAWGTAAGPVPPRVVSTALEEMGDGPAGRGPVEGGPAVAGPVRSASALSRRSTLSSTAPGLGSREGETRRTSATSSVTRGSTESRMSTRASPTVSMARTNRGRPIWRACSARRGVAVPGRSTRDGA